MRWLRRRRDAQDARVADAAAAAKAAAREIEVSRQRAESVRKHVIEPLRKAAEHNQFAALIRQTLINGNGGHP
jgi:hypothetical protein